MGYSVPGKQEATDAGKTGVMNGGALAIGEIAGKAVLGRGLGTAAGGLAAAASEDGEQRDTMSIIAIERAANEVLG